MAIWCLRWRRSLARPAKEAFLRVSVLSALLSFRCLLKMLETAQFQWASCARCGIWTRAVNCQDNLRKTGSGAVRDRDWPLRGARTFVVDSNNRG
ncbi:hypothetical protein BJX68DRAFT_247670 [Aspergillus pseudodeflectus]|uniref:Secreted protein n=1 Tax=Aspergillus pseudodeflectus TaxID=176178 RepID=A0ABR4JHN7_9EURO